MSNQILPMRGNLAWASLPSVDEVEVFDRFNGVPTFGLMRVGSQHTLFWRVMGYVSEFSAWLYVPLKLNEASHLCDEDSADLLTGLVFNSPVERNAWVCVAQKNRLILEREWLLPASTTSEDLILDLARFVAEAAKMILELDLPATRREVMEQTSRAVENSKTILVAASLR